MYLLALQILVICTSLLAWITTSICWIMQLPFCNKKQTSAVTLTAPILFMLWGMNTYTLYETFFLCQGVSFMSSFNCWSFTIIIPLVYLYYNFLVTRILPNKQMWIRHLLLPGVLTIIYMGMMFLSPSAYWTIFRVCCCLISILQITVYAFHLQHSQKLSKLRTLLGRKKIIFLLCFFFIAVANTLATNDGFSILYNLFLTALGSYIIWDFQLYRKIKRIFRLNLPSLSQVHLLPQKQKKIFIPTEKQKKRIEKWLVPDICKSKVTLQMIADDVMIDRADLSIYLKQRLGTSFAKYITSLRLAYAKELLLKKDKNLTMAEIAECTGFQGLSTFYRAFIAQYQLSPLEWKKQAQADNREP